MQLISHKPGFVCPICKSEGYTYTSVERPDGSQRAISLYQCAGCSVVFSDPAKLTEQKRLVLQKYGTISRVYGLVPDKDLDQG